MPARLGEHPPLSTEDRLLKRHRPDQLILPDDPSFLPDFALPPLDLPAELDLPANFDIVRFDESQTFSPFNSQRSQSSNTGIIDGLILPTSSPALAGVFRVEGYNGPSSIGGLSGTIDVGDILEVPEPGFTFGDDGDMIDLALPNELPKTPGVSGQVMMASDAGASARVRQEHEEGRRMVTQVSLAAIANALLRSILLIFLACLLCAPHLISHHCLTYQTRIMTSLLLLRLLPYFPLFLHHAQILLLSSNHLTFF